VSQIINPIKYGGVLYNSLNEFVKEHVPSSNLHHHIATFNSLKNKSASELTNSLFEFDSKLINCDLENGHFLKSSILYTGNFNQIDVNEAIESILSNKRFVFTDNVLKTELIQANKDNSEQLACLLSTHTSISDVFTGIINEYDNLFGKYVFKKAIPTWMHNGPKNLFITRMFSFCPSLIDNYLGVIQKNLPMLNQIDTEHAHWVNIPKEYLVEFDKVHCWGWLAGNGQIEHY
jgi:hypothetical protein